jgi:hypothetical protein
MSIKIDHSRFDSSLPDMAEPALKWINENIRPSETLFEWGSGGSTFWFADRVKELYSVEHSLPFFSYVKEHYLYENYDNINMLFAPEDAQAHSKYKDYYDERSYKRYCESILAYPSRSFDWVIINGKARTVCLELAFSVIKYGGIIVVNDTDKIEYGTAVSKYRSKAIEVFDFKGFKMPFMRQGHTTIMRFA